jgi:hypothetical protein
MDPLPSPDMRIKVANGDRVTTAGVCRVVHVFINAEEFIVDLFVILLDGYDMLLSMHWLHTLGPILWDLAWTHMSCWHDNHRVVW